MAAAYIEFAGCFAAPERAFAFRQPLLSLAIDQLPKCRCVRQRSRSEKPCREGEGEVEPYDESRVLRGLFDQVLGDLLSTSPRLQSHYLAIPDLREPDLLRRAGDRS